MKWQGNNFMVGGVTTTWGTMLKGRSTANVGSVNPGLVMLGTVRKQAEQDRKQDPSLSLTTVPSSCFLSCFEILSWFRLDIRQLLA